MHFIQQQQAPLLRLDQFHDLSAICTALAAVGNHVEGCHTDAGLLQIDLVAIGSLLIVLCTSDKPACTEKQQL